MTHPSSDARRVQRVRHEIKRRELQVARVARISPHFQRITFAGEALADFISASFDDHIKLILPDGSDAPPMRDYTPRRHDAAAGELEIEFALHGDGPAANWAAQAAPGQRVGVGGPRGSFVVPLDYDWHLLVGDDTALPAIARRLEELPAGSRVLALLQLADDADRRELPTRADLKLRWLPPGGGTDALAQAVQALTLPAGEGYAWAAGEAQAVAAVRRALVGTHGLDKDHVRAAAYWKRGAAAHHENLSA